MDVPIIELANDGESSLHNESISSSEELLNDNIQCFQINDSYEKAVHVMFT